MTHSGTKTGNARLDPNTTRHHEPQCQALLKSSSQTYEHSEQKVVADVLCLNALNAHVVPAEMAMPVYVALRTCMCMHFSPISADSPFPKLGGRLNISHNKRDFLVNQAQVLRQTSGYGSRHTTAAKPVTPSSGTVQIVAFKTAAK